MVCDGNSVFTVSREFVAEVAVRSTGIVVSAEPLRFHIVQIYDRIQWRTNATCITFDFQSLVFFGLEFEEVDIAFFFNDSVESIG